MLFFMCSGFLNCSPRITLTQKAPRGHHVFMHVGKNLVRPAKEGNFGPTVKVTMKIAKARCIKSSLNNGLISGPPTLLPASAR